VPYFCKYDQHSREKLEIEKQYIIIITEPIIANFEAMSNKKITRRLAEKTKELWNEHEKGVVIFLGFFLVAAISFQLGILQGEQWQQEPLVIEKVPEATAVSYAGVLGGSAKNNAKDNPTAENSSEVLSESEEGSVECVFVGSKNSDKYHNKACRWATQIKEENRVCFKSEEDAKSKGYLPAGCCMK